MFSTLNANCVYWKVDREEEETLKTTFTSYYGPYKFLWIRDGLKKSPSMFHGVLDVICSTVKWEQVHIYLYYVIVFRNTLKEHIKHVESMLRLLSDTIGTIETKKCFLFTREVYYMVQVTKRGKLEITGRTTDAIKGLKKPRKVAELRWYLWVWNEFRRFLPKL